MDLEAACKKHLGALLQALDEQGVKDISNLRDPLARALAQLYDPVQLQEIVPSFLEAQRQAGLAENTVQAYGWQLRRLVAWLREREIVDVVDVDRGALREWGASLWDGWSAASVKVAVCAARSFFAWCVDERLIASNPAETLKIPRVPNRAQRTVSRSEVRTLLDACDVQTRKGVRDAALVNLLVDTGLRAGEVCRVELATVDLHAQHLFVDIKGGRREKVRFATSATQALARWLPARAEYVQTRIAAGDAAAGDVETLFVSLGGKKPCRPLTVSGLRCILRKLGASAGLSARLCTHAFRRGFAVIATELGAPTRVVQDAGRWEDMDMVQQYTLGMRRGLLYESTEDRPNGWSPADHIYDD